MFNSTPKDLLNLGEEVFKKIPVYRRKRMVNVLYINKELYEKVFNKKYDDKIAKDDIISKFSVTLAKNNQKIGDAFIDYQTDPTGIAMNGNIGSGRAFYIYDFFNIKGDKTPFAVSNRSDYNNGKFSLDCAIHEALISNVLNSTKLFKNFQTLAVIDLKSNYLFPHTKEILPCGLIVRYYENNELYRFSHRFVNKKPFTKKEITLLSCKIGQMEGMKFIERFLHGAWSIGNLSIDSNMIDLDTAFFVNARHPQWSYSYKFITNYFGYEEKGQIKVLEIVINSDLNINHVNIDEVEKIINENKMKTIKEEFPKLLGYTSDIYLKYQDKFDYLADLFYTLAPMIFDNYDNLNCTDDYIEETNLFDFSKLFRYYEIKKQNGLLDGIILLRLLLNEKAKKLVYRYDDEKHHNDTKSFFDKIIVDTNDEFLDSINKAIVFVDKLIELVNSIDNKEKVDINNKLVLSYVRNEERKYLTGKKWIRGELIDIYNNQSSDIVNDIMNMIIKSYSFRPINKNQYITDLNIYEHCFIYREIYNKKNRYVLKFYNKLNDNQITMKINDDEVVFNLSNDELYYSDYFSNQLLDEIKSLSMIKGGVTTRFIEIGRDNYFDEWVETVSSNSNLKDILKKYYGIKALNISKISGGSNDCYLVETRKNRYFLKIFEREKEIDNLLLEYRILNTLQKHRFKVATIKKTKNNRVGVFLNENIIIIEDYIDGEVYHQKNLSQKLLLDSAKELGRMHKVLSKIYSRENKRSEWRNYNSDLLRNDLDYLKKQIKKMKNDQNYELLKEIINYKSSKIDYLKEIVNEFKDISYCMSHGDYSKRQIISQNNEIVGIIDFSSCEIVPIAWEVIRSFFLSTQEFNNDLFLKYVDSYHKEFKLNYSDLKNMPYLLIYQIIFNNYDIIEYVEGNKDKEIIDFIELKYRICLFLEKESVRISNELIDNFIERKVS